MKRYFIVQEEKRIGDGDKYAYPLKCDNVTDAVAEAAATWGKLDESDRESLLRFDLVHADEDLENPGHPCEERGCSYIWDPCNGLSRSFVDWADYEDLVDLAMDRRTEEYGLPALWAWHEYHAPEFWNGEGYEIDGAHNIYPVYDWDEETDTGEVVGYEIR